jgi:hypothetical protein
MVATCAKKSAAGGIGGQHQEKGERRKEKGKGMKEPSGRLQLSHVDNEKTTSESETDSDSDDEAGGSVTQRLERRAEHDCL